MTTTTSRIEHPSALRGRARGYWTAGHATRLAVNLAGLALLAWAVSRPTVADLPSGYLLIPFAGILVGQWAVRRMGWLAWAEVPGAWRTHTSVTEANAAAPDRRADQWLSVVHNAVTAAGGLYLANLPGHAPRVAVGLLGGGMVILFGSRLGRAIASGSFERSWVALLGWIVAAAPALTWVIAGDHAAARYGMVMTLPLLLIVGLARHVITSVR